MNPKFSKGTENGGFLGYVVFSAPFLRVNGTFVPTEMLRGSSVLTLAPVTG